MDFVVTGCAGFIGAQVCSMLLERGDRVAGADNLNDSYDPALKQRRLESLSGSDGFVFYKADISDAKPVNDFFLGVERAFFLLKR